MKRRTGYAIGSAILAVFAVACALAQEPDRRSPQNNVASSAAGPSSAEPSTQAAVKAHDDSFIIGDDDMLSINVWKEPDVSKVLPVRSDGKISLPLVGEVEAAGKTPLQLEHDLTGMLRSYITDPDVTVIVTQINSKKFNILGRVAKPGSYPILGTTTVLDAIAAAGGFQDFAKQKSIYILRQNAAGVATRIPFNYKDVIRGKNPEQNIRLQAHDTVIVP